METNKLPYNAAFCISLAVICFTQPYADCTNGEEWTRTQQVDIEPPSKLIMGALGLGLLVDSIPHRDPKENSIIPADKFGGSKDEDVPVSMCSNGTYHRKKIYVEYRFGSNGGWKLLTGYTISTKVANCLSSCPDVKWKGKFKADGAENFLGMARLNFLKKIGATEKNGDRDSIKVAFSWRGTSDNRSKTDNDLFLKAKFAHDHLYYLSVDYFIEPED